MSHDSDSGVVVVERVVVLDIPIDALSWNDLEFPGHVFGVAGSSGECADWKILCIPIGHYSCLAVRLF